MNEKLTVMIREQSYLTKFTSNPIKTMQQIFFFYFFSFDTKDYTNTLGHNFTFNESRHLLTIIKFSVLNVD